MNYAHVTCTTCAPFVPIGAMKIKDNGGTLYIPVSSSPPASPGPEDDPQDFAFIMRKDLAGYRRTIQQLMTRVKALEDRNG